jgi:hypothetical protein
MSGELDEAELEVRFLDIARLRLYLTPNMQ